MGALKKKKKSLSILHTPWASTPSVKSITWQVWLNSDDPGPAWGIGSVFTDEVLARAPYTFEMRRREVNGEIISDLRVTVALIGQNPSKELFQQTTGNIHREKTIQPLEAAWEVSLDKWTQCPTGMLLQQIKHK